MSRRHRASSIGLGVFAAAAFAPVQPVAAQALEEIVVTARQRAEAITDVPAAITAFTENDIERAGIERAGDFLNLTPGVNLTNTAEVGDTQVSIRGINGTRDAEANFAFIQDGILYTNPSAFNREFSDVRQIEVLKGPQGAIYGRSASAGAVIVTTRKPGNEFEGFVKGSAGFDAHYFGQIAFGGPIVKDQLYGRVNFDYRTSDGVYHNAFLRDDVVDDFENYNVDARLVWEPNDRLSVDTKFRYGEVPEAAAIAFNAALALDLPLAPGVLLFEPQNVNDHQFAFHANLDPINEQESLEFSVKLDYDMDWATVTAWTLYSDIDQFFFSDGTSGAFGFFATEPSCIATSTALAGFPVHSGAGPNSILDFAVGPGAILPPYSPTTCDGGQLQVRNQEDVSFEIRLTSPDEQRLRWLGGFYFLDLEREVGVAQTRDDGTAAAQVRSFSDPFVEALVHDRFDTTVYSVFGAFDYDITDSLTGSFAIRYDREEREVQPLVPPPSVRRSTFIEYTDGVLGPDDGLPGSPLNPAFVDFATGAILDSIPARDDVFEEVQPKVSLTWDMTDDWTWFASWGVGFKSGGFNNTGSSATVINLVNPALTGVQDSFAKETSNNFEVGFKSIWAGGRVKVEGTVFYTDIEDMQFFNFFVGSFGLLRVVTNIDEVSILGGELGWSAAMTDHLTVFGGAAVVDGEIDKNSVRPDTVGNEVPYAPKWTFNIGADYVRPALPGWDLVSRIDYRITGETWFHTVQDQTVPATLFGGIPADFTSFERDDFDLINLRVGFASQDGTWQFMGTVRNLLNEDYLEEVIPAPEFGGAFIHPGSQRTWAIEAVYRF